jgi:dipeptidyl aminopeptidase/acylaminoacyl peptidase
MIKRSGRVAWTDPRRRRPSKLLMFETQSGTRSVFPCPPKYNDPMVLLTQSPGIDAHPCWTPDGRSLVFATDRWGGLELTIARADGTELRRLTQSPGSDDYPAVSPDGTRLAFASYRRRELRGLRQLARWTRGDESLEPSRARHHAHMDSRRAGSYLRVRSRRRLRPQYGQFRALTFPDDSPHGRILAIPGHRDAFHELRPEMR